MAAVINEEFDCYITQQVYNEVMKGKEKSYDDAFLFEKLVEEKKCKKLKVEPLQIIFGLGIGESSTLQLFKKINADFIISDDQKFISYISKMEISFFVVTDIIFLLFIKKRIDKKDALEALENIRPLVRHQNYLFTKQKLEED